MCKVVINLQPPMIKLAQKGASGGELAWCDIVQVDPC